MRPESTAELCELIARTETPLRLSGGGTRSIGTAEGAPLDLSGLSGVTLYEPGALTLVARAGTPLSEIEALLTRERQRLPFEPAQLGPVLGREGVSTIGGVVATNTSGPRRVQAGACRDSLIGVEFVDGHGTAIRNGGRVMKNVTGYDLVKLMAGSHGTLGVLTEVAFKLLPEPETEATLILHGLTEAEALRAMTQALRTPWEISGAAMSQAGRDGFGLRQVALRLEGFETHVTRRLQRLQAHLAEFAQQEALTSPEASQQHWREIRDLTPLQGAETLIKVSIRPSHLPYLLEACDGEGVVSMADWGGGLLWLAAPASQADGLLDRARAALARHGGHATRLTQSGTRPAFQPEPAPVARLSQGLRDQFDPKGIFNRGLMG